MCLVMTLVLYLVNILSCRTKCTTSTTASPTSTSTPKKLIQIRVRRLEQQGVIRKVTQYTDWVNGIVLVKRKNNTICVCLDPRQLNKNIVTSNHFIRRLDDILPEMTNATYFTVVDTKNGY